MRQLRHISTATFAALDCFLLVGTLGIYMKASLLSGQWTGIARAIGKLSRNEIGAAQRIGFYFNDIVIDLVVVPVAATILASMLFRSYRAGVATCASAILILLLFYQLQAQGSVGQYMSFGMLLGSLRFGIANPEIAGAYVSMAALAKLALLFSALLLLWYMARCAARNDAKGNARRSSLYRAALVLPTICMAIGVAIVSPISYLHRHPGWVLNESSSLQAARSLISRPAFRAHAGASFEDSLAAMRKLARSPTLNAHHPYVGTEAGANLLVFVMETGPSRALDIAASGPKLPGAGALFDHSFVARQHYTTFPYTSDATYSILSGLYPNGRRRLLAHLKGRHVNGLMTALADQIPVRAEYTPNLNRAEMDADLFADFGINRLYVADERLTDKERIAARQRANTFIASLRRHGSTFTGSELVRLKRALVDDFQALGKLESDLDDALEHHHRFAMTFRPEIAHAPWIPLHNEHSILARGHDLMILEDQWLAELVGVLRAHGQLRNTIIVFLADHGIRTRDEDPDLPVGRISDYTFHVPLMIYAPRTLQKTHFIDAPSTHLDVAPTVLALMGYTQAAAKMEGVPIWQRHAAQRIFFWSGAYTGVNGFVQDGQYYMQQVLSGITYRSNRAGFVAGFPASSALDPGTSEARAVGATISEADGLQESMVSELLQQRQARPTAARKAGQAPAIATHGEDRPVLER